MWAVVGRIGCNYFELMEFIVVPLQNVLRELEQKKPQLDELVHTAENLKAEPNRQQLHGKGKILFLLKKHFLVVGRS